MFEPTEDLDKLSKELRQLADEIAEMKSREVKMEHGPERKNLKREIKEKQHQALFYIEKITNLEEQGKKKRK